MHHLPQAEFGSRPCWGFFAKKSNELIETDKRELIVILASTLGSISFLCALIALFTFFVYRRRVHRYRKLSKNAATEEFTLRSFSYDDLETATDGFRGVG